MLVNMGVFFTWVSAASVALAAGQESSGASVPGPSALGADLWMDLSNDGFVDDLTREGTLAQPTGGTRQGGCSFFVDLDDPSNPYGGTPEQRQALLEAIRKDWAGFQVTIDIVRPSGPHQRCRAGLAGCSAPYPNGTAAYDCGNQRVSDELCFANVCANQVAALHLRAQTVSQEIGHTLGLMHVDNPKDLMVPMVYSNSPDAEFLNECLPISAGGQICSGQRAGCPAGQQNSYKEIAILCGEAAADVTPPTAKLTAPTEGRVFAECTSFEIRAEAMDDRSVASVKLLVNGGREIGTDVQAPYSWAATRPGPGTYTFVAVAVDRAGNEGRSMPLTVTVMDSGMGCAVAPPPVPLPPTPGPSSTATGSTAGSATSASGSTGGSLTGMPSTSAGTVPTTVPGITVGSSGSGTYSSSGGPGQGTGEPGGCECRSAGSSREAYGWTLAVVVVAAGAGRSRRRLGLVREA